MIRKIPAFAIFTVALLAASTQAEQKRTVRMYSTPISTEGETRLYVGLELQNNLVKWLETSEQIGMTERIMLALTDNGTDNPGEFSLLVRDEGKRIDAIVELTVRGSTPQAAHAAIEAAKTKIREYFPPPKLSKK
jgi:hypothetical protein